MFAKLLHLFSRLSRDQGTAGVAVFGIGNTGEMYERTRHNIGFDVVGRAAGRMENARTIHACHAEVSTGELGGVSVVLARPHTYVNRSGIAVKAVLRKYGVSEAKCLVVLDDFNLPLGLVRIRREGSDGGHKGLRSIISEIGVGFPRLRVGIGAPPEGESVVDFVLGEFAAEEIVLKEEAVSRAVEAVECFCREGVQAAMRSHNMRAHDHGRPG